MSFYNKFSYKIGKININRKLLVLSSALESKDNFKSFKVDAIC